MDWECSEVGQFAAALAASFKNIYAVLTGKIPIPAPRPVSTGPQTDLEKQLESLRRLRNSWLKLKAERQRVVPTNDQEWKITTAFSSVQALRAYIIAELSTHPRTGTLLALVGDLKVDMKDMKPEATFEHAGGSRGFTQMPNGHLVSFHTIINNQSVYTSSIKVWDLSGLTPKCEITIENIPVQVTCIKALPNGQLVIASENGIELWNIEKPDKPACVVTLKHHEGKHHLLDLAVHPKGQLISRETGGDIKAWDITTRVCTATFYSSRSALDGRMDGWAVLSSGQVGVLVTKYTSFIHLWDISRDEYIKSIVGSGHINLKLDSQYTSQNIGISQSITLPNGKMIAEGPQCVLLIDVSNNISIPLVPVSRYLPIRVATLLPDGRVAISITDGGIRLYNFMQTGMGLNLMEWDWSQSPLEQLRVLTTLADGRLVVGCSNGAIKLFRCPIPQYQIVIDWRFQSVFSTAGVLTEIKPLSDGVKLTTSQSCKKAFRQCEAAIKTLYPGATLHFTITDRSMQVNGFTFLQIEEFLSFITALLKPTKLDEVDSETKQHQTSEEIKLEKEEKYLTSEQKEQNYSGMSVSSSPRGSTMREVQPQIEEKEKQYLLKEEKARQPSLLLSIDPQDELIDHEIADLDAQIRLIEEQRRVAALKREYDQKEVNTFKQKLVSLLTQEDGGYQFTLRRPANNQLIIRFTEFNSMSDIRDQIREKLLNLKDVFNEACRSLGIPKERYVITFNWENWTLTIKAEPLTLDKIAKLLQVAGFGYLSSAVQTQSALFYQPREQKSLQGPPTAAEEKEPIEVCALQ